VNNFFVDGSCVIKGGGGGCIFFVFALVLKGTYFSHFFSPGTRTLEQDRHKYTANSDPARFDVSNELSFFAIIPATLLFCANLATTNLPLAVYMESGTSFYISFPFIMLMVRSMNSVCQNIRTVLKRYEQGKECVCMNLNNQQDGA